MRKINMKKIRLHSYMISLIASEYLCIVKSRNLEMVQLPRLHTAYVGINLTTGFDFWTMKDISLYEGKFI